MKNSKIVNIKYLSSNLKSGMVKQLKKKKKKKNSPIFVKKIYNLLIEDRKALKMDMSADFVKIKVQVSTMLKRSLG